MIFLWVSPPQKPAFVFYFPDLNRIGRLNWGVPALSALDSA